MQRRTVLAGLASVSFPLAGCLGGADAPREAPNTPGGGGDGMDGTDPPGGTDTTRNDVAVRSASLSSLAACPEASVEGTDGTVVCRGCVRGKNGCAVAVLDGAAYDADAGELRVVVATEEDREEGTMCTQAVVRLGYEVTVELSDGPPETVVLVEDDVDGRREVLAESVRVG